MGLNLHKIKTKFDKYYWRRIIQSQDNYKTISTITLYTSKVLNLTTHKLYARKEYRTYLIGAQMT
jgi:hypothetical protein